MYPLDVILNIVEELEVQEVMRVAQTCRLVHSMVVHSKSVWRRLIQRHRLESDSIEPSYSSFRLYYTKRKRWMDASFITDMDNYAIFQLDRGYAHPDYRIFMCDEYVGVTMKTVPLFISLCDDTAEPLPEHSPKGWAEMHYERDWFVANQPADDDGYDTMCYGPCGVHFIHTPERVTPLSVTDGALVVKSESGLHSFKLGRCATPHDHDVPMVPLHEYRQKIHYMAKINTETFGLFTGGELPSMSRLVVSPDGRFEQVGEESVIRFNGFCGFDANAHILAAHGDNFFPEGGYTSVVQVSSDSGEDMHDYGKLRIRVLLVVGHTVLVGTSHGDGLASLEARTSKWDLLWRLEDVLPSWNIQTQVISMDLVMMSESGNPRRKVVLVNIAKEQVVWQINLPQLCVDFITNPDWLPTIVWRCNGNALVLWINDCSSRGIPDVVKVLRF